jgi:hypothetical protein
VAGDLTKPTEVATVVEERGLRGISEGLVREGIEGESSLAFLRSASAKDLHHPFLFGLHPLRGQLLPLPQHHL